MKRYKNASELYDLFYKERTEDIIFYGKMLSRYKPLLKNNRVLEIGAGTGRILLPLAQKNPDLEFHAIDIIADEIAILENKIKKANIKNIITHVSDISEFKSDEKFSLAIAPFRVLQHCQSLNEMDKFISNTKNLLNDDGRFIFDLFNPWLHMLTQNGEVFNGQYKDEEGNSIERKIEINQRDLFNQTQNIEEYYQVRYTDGKIENFKWLYTTGYFFKDTAALILDKNELDIENLYGNFDQTKFGKNKYPGELIFDCIKRNRERC